MLPVRNLPNTKSVLPSADLITKLLDDLLVALRGELTAEFNAAVTSDVVEAARAFVALRHLKDKIDETDTAFNKLFEPAKNETMPQKFEEAGVPSVTLDEGQRVTVSHLVRASVKGGKKDEAFQWLRDNGLGDTVSETVNSSTLSAVAKSLIEDGSELDEDLFSVHVLPTTSVTRTR